MSNGDMFKLRLSENILVSLCVLGGYYGNGSDRERQLKEAGYDPEEIQDCVNDLYDVFKKWGVEFG